MNDIQLRSRIGPDGILTLNVPFGPADANRQVVITVSPEPEQIAISREEWLNAVEATAGSIPDPTFTRQVQGEFEQRDEWR